MVGVLASGEGNGGLDLIKASKDQGSHGNGAVSGFPLRYPSDEPSYATSFGERVSDGPDLEMA